MKKKKVWITGASGFLGSVLLPQSMEKYETIGLYYRNTPLNEELDTYQVDLCDHEKVAKLFTSTQPAIVFHTAAMANSTMCRMQPEKSHEINVAATKHLSALCQANKCKLVLISTDLVFEGDKPPYAEEDKPNPLMTYAKHKYEAEQIVLNTHTENLIVRIPLLLGFGDNKTRGVLAATLNSLQSGKEVMLFEDEYRTPLSVNEAAEGILKFCHLEGIIHLSGTERISRFELGLKIKEAFGVLDARVKATLQSEQNFSEPRPKDVSLDCSKAIGLGFKPSTINEALRLAALEVVQ